MSGRLVVVVGSINVDLVVHTDRLPVPGETVLGGTFERHGGGKGANQAVAAARAGSRVMFVGAVGDDDLGADALAVLEAEGIDVSRVGRLRGVSTGVALIVVDGGGENQIAVASGANAAVEGTWIEAALDADDLHPDDVLLTNLEIPDDAVVAGARRAAAAGMELVINPAPARELPAALVDLGPMLTPNQGEAQHLTGMDDPEVAGHRLAERTGRPVVVTLGRRGALLCDGGRSARVPAPSVEVVDTTGAGDAFNGVLAAALADELPLSQAVERAVVAAALSVRRRGARGGMPTGPEIDKEG